jgi:hypothetical protein
VLRLTGTERAVAEVAAIAEHVASLTAASAAFQLQPDVPVEWGGSTGALVPLLDERSAPNAASTLGEIREWSRASLDVDRVPAVWRALAHQPRLLHATWRKDRVVMDAGTLEPLVKGCVALAVAQFRQSTYWIPYFTQFLRKACGLDDSGVVEVAGAVMHYVSFNTIAHGMRLEPPVAEITAADVAPGGRWEHIIPPGARRQPARAAAGSSSERK